MPASKVTERAQQRDLVDAHDPEAQEAALNLQIAQNDDRGPSAIRDDARPFAQRFGAGLRIITDLATPNESVMMITPGQSGSPLSGHFADLPRRWRNFAWLVPGRSASVSTLVLAPVPLEPR